MSVLSVARWMIDLELTVLPWFVLFEVHGRALRRWETRRTARRLEMSR